MSESHINGLGGRPGVRIAEEEGMGALITSAVCDGWDDIILYVAYAVESNPSGTATSTRSWSLAVEAPWPLFSS